jgi:hypothetical protein
MDNEKLFELLDDIRECSTCSDKNVCREYLFSKLAEEKIVKENSLENNFIGRLLARSLSWMVVEETNMMYVIDENGLSSKDDVLPPPEFEDDDTDDFDDDDFDFSSEFMSYSNPIIHHLNNTREQMRETIKMLLHIKDREQKNGGNSKAGAAATTKKPTDKDSKNKK